ncbi:hypothetical protein Gotur_032885 [Gossypium turneri]
MLFLRHVLGSIFIVCCLTTLTNGATLANDEVEALKWIGKTLGKTGWNFDSDPCSQRHSWFLRCFDAFLGVFVSRLAMGAVVLVSDLILLQGVFIMLKKIMLLNAKDVSYFSSLLGNRLTGQIPAELVNLRNLTSLVLESNGLSGTLPAALGNLSKIERLHLSSNNFTGKIPETFVRLTSLKEL